MCMTRGKWNSVLGREIIVTYIEQMRSSSPNARKALFEIKTQLGGVRKKRALHQTRPRVAPQIRVLPFAGFVWASIQGRSGRPAQVAVVVLARQAVAKKTWNGQWWEGRAQKDLCRTARETAVVTMRRAVIKARVSGV